MAKWNAYYFSLVLVAILCLFVIVGHLLGTFNILCFSSGSTSTILIISLLHLHEFFLFFSLPLKPEYSKESSPPYELSPSLFPCLTLLPHSMTSKFPFPVLSAHLCFVLFFSVKMPASLPHSPTTSWVPDHCLQTFGSYISFDQAVSCVWNASLFICVNNSCVSLIFSSGIISLRKQRYAESSASP